MTGGHGDHRVQRPNPRKVADGPDEVRRAVRIQLKAGADWIKLMASGGLGGMPEYEDPRYVEYSFEELRAGVEEAHKRWTPVCVHAYATGGIKNSVEAGVDCIEHGVIMDEEVIEMMVEKDVSWVPTITGMYNLYVREKKAGNDDFAQLMEEVVIEPHKVSIELGLKAGVRIGLGTDTLGEIIQEIQMLHEYGMTPMEALMAATRVSAEVVRIQDVVGTIEAGKKADLLMVNGNPLEDLEDMRRVRRVFKDGKEVTPTNIEKSILQF
jgi:imidazolonepropionase-like amidohydrolase